MESCSLTHLEHEIFQDGFLLLLVDCVPGNQRGTRSVTLTLFDGGRQQQRMTCREVRETLPPNLTGQVRQLLRCVLPSPYLLVGRGRGWRGFVKRYAPQAAPHLRMFDLDHAVKSFESFLPSDSSDPELLEPEPAEPETVEEERGIYATETEELTWSLFEAAGRRGVADTTSLFASLEEPVKPAGIFEQAADAFPGVPGVYLMKDSGNNVLYVGKAANLARRMKDYCYQPHRVSETSKPRQFYEAVADVDYITVGSELHALLEEHRRIQTYRPPWNKRVHILSGSSRYHRGSCPSVVVFLPSVEPAKVSLFFFGDTQEEAAQLDIFPRKPAKRLLQRLVDYARGNESVLKGHSKITKWGTEGNALCIRYWSYCRNELSWMLLDRVENVQATVEDITDVAATVDQAPEPAEFRTFDIE